ncbi:uncharacterized protein LOC110984583 [Acanthaster planci]|uniref:Uncharacterized protein LOC110984583 n=1 Tax=Acanthaster planci TaxID=133434 RepID=A0A8B7Z6M4_ACAPL|nr:uncharacterized protein LOC110984583 [Acanthaster planci]
MDNFKRLMRAVGIIHLIDGILLPILWGLGFLFVGTYYSPIAAPVWGGALFLIPAGILSLVVISTRNRKLLVTCGAFNLMGEVAVWIAGGATVYVLIADLNLSDELYIADVAIDILTIVLCGLEIVACFIGVRGIRYAIGMLEEQSTQANGTTVVCNAQGCDNPTMQQHPGQPAQVQIVGASTQGQYPEQQGHYPGQQKHYPGHASGNLSVVRKAKRLDPVA